MHNYVVKNGLNTGIYTHGKLNNSTTIIVVIVYLIYPLKIDGQHSAHMLLSVTATYVFWHAIQYKYIFKFGKMQTTHN